MLRGPEDRGAEFKTPKASRGREWGGGIPLIPLPSQLGSLGERRKLSQRGPGGAPAENGFCCTLGLKKTNLVMTNLIFLSHLPGA